ncbi:SGNH/GDSL hydrolase family protein [Mesobacillus jeotgali]|uniref:SGNH/GDSL hydrolase family protein n=1 Tax=Mesobacillus jeotgali TaxID=129985 RepID=UPI0017805178|nr:SGNH/GDSL hydrolase family protein [Mesobacillus jeotgali]UYZ21804.1 SGNH/GDSL hydrolase family protein [Mesobacillus jeotgali]
MKVLFTTLLAIVCMGVLLWGNIHWTQKTAVSGSNDASPSVTATKKAPVEGDPTDSLTQLTENWPTEAAESFEKAIEEKRIYKILLVGSPALGDDQTGWAASTKEQLIAAYGEENMEVEIRTYSLSSLGFINEDGAEQIANAQADMVLFEPFTLMDNGEVSVENSLANLQQVMDETLEAKPETAFVLMPPHPIYNAVYYPKQVEALKNYAEENEIPYLDHWQAWPDYQTEEIKDYISSDNSQPNEQGHEVWSKYVIEYLISK